MLRIWWSVLLGGRVRLLRLTVFAPLVAVACGGAAPRSPATGSRDTLAAAVGVADARPLPAIALPDLSGRLQSVRADAHQVTLINFWATWCLREIRELVTLHDHGNAGGVRVVGIAIASGSRDDIRAFAAKHGMDYFLLDADENWGRRCFGELGVPMALPVTLVVDRRGVICHRLIGPQTLAQFQAAVREAGSSVPLRGA